MTPADLIKRYVEIRATKTLMVAEQAAELKPYNEALETIELALLDALNSNGLDNIKSPYGTAYKSTLVNTKMTDRQALIADCKARDNFDVFTNSLTKEVVKAYLEENKQAPPGVEISTFTTVNVRKS